MSNIEIQLVEAMHSLELSERFKQSIIDSLPANIAVIDEHGVIVAVNRQWTLFGGKGSLADDSCIGVGVNYLDVCRRAVASGPESDESAAEALAGIRKVLRGRRKSFNMDYPCHTPDKKQWFQMNVSRHDNGLPGAIITHTDITRIKKLEEERRQYTRHVIDSIETERLRIARELHDAIGQALTLLSFDISRVRQELSPGCEDVSDRLLRMYGSIQEMVVTIEQICTNLRPALLDDLGLKAAIDWVSEDFARRTGIEIAVTWNGEPCLNPCYATDIFRIVQEALNNSSKYSQATRIEITFTRNSPHCQFIIRDNGRGFDVNRPASGSGFGIMGMRERAAALEAVIEIKSSPATGTLITLDIPCGAEENCQ